MQKFVREFGKKEDPNQLLREVIIPDNVDADDVFFEDEANRSNKNLRSLMGKVTVQAEDFGGSLALPQFYRPSAD